VVAGDPRSTRAWRRLRDLVVLEEPVCQLRLLGCTYFSQTADHIVAYRDAPHLALVRSNLRGACQSCNWRRGTFDLDTITTLDLAPDALAFFE
jgi:5-methylcytosine-specific restriction endonuclease McrA